MSVENRVEGQAVLIRGYLFRERVQEQRGVGLFFAGPGYRHFDCGEEFVFAVFYQMCFVFYAWVEER